MIIIYLNANHIVNILVELKDQAGSPIWQYVMGRAVIIGIFYRHIYFGSCSNKPNDPSLAVRVSSYIDWIMSVTGLDIWHLQQIGHTGQYRNDKGELNFTKGIEIDNIT